MNIKWTANLNPHTITLHFNSFVSKKEFHTKFLHSFLVSPTYFYYIKNRDIKVSLVAMLRAGGIVIRYPGTPREFRPKSPHLQWGSLKPFFGGTYPEITSMSLISFKICPQRFGFLSLSTGLYLFPDCHFAFPSSQ